MYLAYEKGVRAWGVGVTPRRATEEALDHGAEEVNLTVSPCTLGVWEWAINTLYPEEKFWGERADGTLCLLEEINNNIEEEGR